MPIAINKDRKVTTIFDAVQNENYYCPVCGSDVIPKAIGENCIVTPHFAHIDKSKCSSESVLHFWFKNQLLVKGDKFIVKTDNDNEFVCSEVLVEQPYDTAYGIYQPDATIITESGQTIFIEINYSNKKNPEEYLNKWLELKNIVIEVDIKTTLDYQCGKSIYQFKALFYDGKRFATKKRDIYQETIGEHKQKVYKSLSCLEIDRIESFKKLDWFWNCAIKYKNGDQSIDELYDLIESVDKNDKRVIMDILDKKMCNSLHDDYWEYKKDYYTKYIKNIPLKGLNIDIDYSDVHLIIKNSQKVKCWDRYIYLNCNKTDIETNICESILKIMYEKVEINLNKWLEKYYEDYSFGSLKLNYKHHCIFKLSMPDEIINTLDYKIISKFIRFEIKKYFDALIPIDNLEEILSYINRLTTKYRGIIFKEFVHEEFQNKNYYKTYFYNIIAEPIGVDIINIYLYRERFKNYWDKINLKQFHIRNNKLYFGEYNYYNEISSDLIVCDFFNDINELYNCLANTISNIIRNEKYPPLIKKEDITIG
ncbi:MAG: hypothetical protein PHO86_05320 [Bacilli bacterium]|nr:hypothetical protein [Bacilli bacterium]MDD4804635.1 hypothetical protein [Candidatus Paceibacterota bacterium]